MVKREKRVNTGGLASLCENSLRQQSTKGQKERWKEGKRKRDTPRHPDMVRCESESAE